jgi:hypothetical protein
MKKPTLKNGMNVFVGCDIGENRLGYLKNAKSIQPYIELVNKGYLIANDQGSRIWFALTAKGKEHVVRVERYYVGCL